MWKNALLFNLFVLNRLYVLVSPFCPYGGTLHSAASRALIVLTTTLIRWNVKPPALIHTYGSHPS